MNTATPSTRIRVLIATAIVSAFASSFATVCAAGDSDTVNITVKYADLNLSNPQGAATLYRRLVAAAQQVCGTYDISSGRFRPQGACVRKSLEDAVTKVGQPALFAVYNAKHQQPLPVIVASAQTR